MKARNNTDIQLFIQPRISLATPDEELAQALAAKGFADIYTLRQRLQGEFPARLAHGDEAQMDKLAQVLEEHQRPYRRITPQEPSFIPEDLEEISLDDSHVSLHGPTTKIRCAPGVQLLAIVADISGKIGERHLKRRMVRHTYGASAPDIPDPSVLEQEIFRLAPILDIYTLSGSGNIDAGIRIIPGKFDHRQLGEAASLSRNKNLAILWEKILASGAQIKTHHGFGLGFIPECAPETVAHANPYTQQDNLRSLAQYAWMMAELEKNPDSATTGSNRAGNNKQEPKYPYALAPFFEPTSNPGNNAKDLPSGAGEESEKSTQEREPVNGGSSLPSPPDPTTLSGLKLHIQGRRLLPILGIVAVISASLIQTDPGADLMEILFSAGVGQALLSGGCFYFGIKYLILKRRIEDTPTSKIRSMAMGMVEVQGRAQRVYALVSPISGLPCVYYRIKKYRRKRFRSNRRLISGNSQSQWALVSITSSSNVPFVLDDGTGTIEVVPDGAELKIRTTHSGSGAMAQLPFNTSEARDPNERWEEEVIPQGSHVYILGFARTHNENPAHQDLLRQALFDLKQDKERLHQFDSDGDGHIDASEWDQARRATERNIAHEQLRQTDSSHSGLHASISQPPRKDYPYLIAETESELHLTQKLTYYSGILLAAGFSLALWGVYAAGQTLGLF
ncbi:MAG: GIDE domain-containing protein [Thermodesulfobacteriota bacterium]